MNPTFMAMQQAIMQMSFNMLMGIPYVPKKDKETSINGRAFAPGTGVQQMESSEEKEAKVRTHLDKLAKEAKARYLDECSKYPTIEEHSYPRSDMVVLMEETQAKARGKANGVGYPSDSKVPKCPTIAEIAAERHRNHQDYIDRQIALNRTTYRETPLETVEPVEPKYPTSDLIELLEEHIAEVNAAELLAKTTAAFRAAADKRREAARQ